MSAVDDLLASLPMDRLAAQLGVDEATAERATRQALPALLGGMEANAQDPAGAASLETAVAQHDPDAWESGIDSVDTADGQKIVSHVFGANEDQVVNHFVEADSGLMKKLLPLLAPLVMSYLADQMAKKNKADKAPKDGGIMADILGRVVGNKDGKLGIDDVLGGLLGGGTR